VFDDLVHPDIGIEFDWLATAADGRVAFFATAGYGAVPLAATTATEPGHASLDRDGSAWPVRL
jgi:hypothetical protein